jgi:hypothetical protein
LPYLQAAFTSAIRDFSEVLPIRIRPKLTELVQRLCDPDYRHRGDPLKTSSGRFSLERYISTLDLLSREAEVLLRGQN